MTVSKPPPPTKDENNLQVDLLQNIENDIPDQITPDTDVVHQILKKLYFKCTNKTLLACSWGLT